MLRWAGTTTMVLMLAFSAGCGTTGGGMGGIEKGTFGELEGQTVGIWTLENAHGVRCKISELGATVTELWLPDRRGAMADVVLGFHDPTSYRTRSPYFGCTAGRVANRIANGRFTVDGVEYKLATNNGPNHLHGGEIGFDKKVWSSEGKSVANGFAVDFRLRSPDGDEGYPGTLDAVVTYTLTDDDELIVDFSATTDQATPVNLVHHTYWNLGGHDSGDVLDHELELACARYTPTDGTLIPTGELAPVAGTPFDFTRAAIVGARIGPLRARPEDGHGGGYDLNYVVDGAAGALRTVASVLHPASGRRMEIESDQPGVQFYTGNFLDGTVTGKGETVYNQYAGFCLETQNYPNAVNTPSFPNAVLRPGETYRHRMIHRFSVNRVVPARR